LSNSTLEFKGIFKGKPKADKPRHQKEVHPLSNQVQASKKYSKIKSTKKSTKLTEQLIQT